MRPILIFAIAAIAASAVGVGALNNEITLFVQQFGVGSSEITSPIKAASVDFEITPIKVINETNPDQSIIKNLITGCSFHSDENISHNATNAGNPYIICKLSSDGKIVAEGNYTITALGGYEQSTRLIVPIDTLAYPGANDFRNINDVHLIVVGEDLTQKPLE
jgi:hypothetical protein